MNSGKVSRLGKALRGIPQLVIVNESGMRHHFVEQLVQRLNLDGVSVEVLTLNVPGPIHEWIDSRSSNASTWFASPRISSALRHLNWYRGKTLVFALGHRAGALSLAARKLLGIPYAFSFVHQTNYFSLMVQERSWERRLRGQIHRRIETKYLCSALWIQSVSRDSTLRLMDENVETSSIREIPLGVDFSRYSLQASDSTWSLGEIVIPDNAPFILSVGRLAPEKNHQLTLAAFRIFAERFPNFHLVILGEGPLLNDLLEKTTSLGLSEKVHFPGFVRNPEDYFRQATIFSHASLSEAYASVQLEARLNNLPVVSFGCGVALDMAAMSDPLVCLMKSHSPKKWAEAWTRHLTQHPRSPWDRPDEVYWEHDLPNVLTGLSDSLRESIEACRMR